MTDIRKESISLRINDLNFIKFNQTTNKKTFIDSLSKQEKEELLEMVVDGIKNKYKHRFEKIQSENTAYKYPRIEEERLMNLEFIESHKLFDLPHDKFEDEIKHLQKTQNDLESKRKREVEEKEKERLENKRKENERKEKEKKEKENEFKKHQKAAQQNLQIQRQEEQTREIERNRKIEDYQKKQREKEEKEKILLEEKRKEKLDETIKSNEEYFLKTQQNIKEEEKQLEEQKIQKLEKLKKGFDFKELDKQNRKPALSRPQTNQQKPLIALQTKNQVNQINNQNVLQNKIIEPKFIARPQSQLDDSSVHKTNMNNISSERESEILKSAYLTRSGSYKMIKSNNIISK